MFKFYLASFIACFLVTSSLAQKKQNVYFLKDDGRYVINRDSSDFVRIVQEPDSGSVLYIVLDYYPNGSLKMIAKTAVVEPLKLEGTAVSYYPDKSKKQIATYEKGELVGNVYDYYPNGKLYRTVTFEYTEPENGLQANEMIKNVFDSTGTVLVKDGMGHYPVFDDTYKNILEDGEVKNGKKDSVWKSYSNGKLVSTQNYAAGKLVSGNRPDENRNNMIYNIKEAWPTFKGGNNALGQFLGNTIRYPTAAKDKNIQGKVILEFVVEKDGSITNVKLVKTVDREIDAEAVRVIKLSPNWNPGLKNGVPVRVSYTMPLSFTLSTQ